MYSGETADASPRVLREVELEPGGFHQFSPVLGTVVNGYVKVERVEGEAPFYAYGVINDQVNSDGSFVFPVTASSLEGTMGQTLPVIVETRDFTSELTVTNFSEESPGCWTSSCGRSDPGSRARRPASACFSKQVSR